MNIAVSKKSDVLKKYASQKRLAKLRKYACVRLRLRKKLTVLKL